MICSANNPLRPARQSRTLRATAYHEAGHAVMALALCRRFRYVTIVPWEDTSGRLLGTECPAWFRPDLPAGITNEPLDSPDPPPRVASALLHERWIDREVLISLAGIAAERCSSGRNNWRGAKSDFNGAIELASYLYDGPVLEKYIDFKLAMARWMVASRKFAVQIEAVAEALLEHQTLNARRVREICRAALLAGCNFGPGVD